MAMEFIAIGEATVTKVIGKMVILKEKVPFSIVMALYISKVISTLNSQKISLKT